MAQAEHDINAKAVLITNSSKLANDVEASIKKNLSKLSRKKIAEKSWTDNGLIILVKNLLEGLDMELPEELKSLDNPSTDAHKLS